MSFKKVIIFSAPSGAGKTTIVKYLLQQGLAIEFSISACTRKPRGKEIDGLDYHFLSIEEFKNKINNREFVEWEEVYDDMFYGTLQSELDRIWQKNKQVVFDVDVIGALNLKRVFKERSLSIFVSPPSLAILEKRLKSRGTDSNQDIEKRLAKAKEEMGKKDDFDVIIKNENLDVACQEALEKINLFLKK
jgi:guanylate kinase